MKLLFSFVLILVLNTQLLNAVPTNNSGKKIREGYILYKIKPNALPSELKSLNGLLHSNVLSEYMIEELDVHVAQLNSKGRELAISKLIMASDAVEFVEPDMIIPASFVPNDPNYSQQWHHQKIQTPLVWDTLTHAKNVKVCVLDTGVDTDHPDLVDNLLPGFNVNGLNSVEDKHGHGTAIAGVIGAVGNNNLGGAGVLFGVDIVPIQINISNTESSAYTSTMAEGIRLCADQGGKVANLSYGGAEVAVIDSAAQYLRDKGGLLFMSAGNDGIFHDTASFPDYNSFVVVGATNAYDSKAPFSEYGPFIDIVAPGANIFTTDLNSEYATFSGTSFSSPIATAIGAMIYSINPNFTPAEVEHFMYESAVDLGNSGEDDYYGVGRIDAYAALQLALTSLKTENNSTIDQPNLNLLLSQPKLYTFVDFDGDNNFFTISKGETNNQLNINYKVNAFDSNFNQNIVSEVDYFTTWTGVGYHGYANKSNWIYVDGYVSDGEGGSVRTIITFEKMKRYVYFDLKNKVIKYKNYELYKIEFVGYFTEYYKWTNDNDPIELTQSQYTSYLSNFENDFDSLGIVLDKYSEDPLPQNIVDQMFNDLLYNFPPTANAGLDQSVAYGETVFFDASDSFDIDGNISTYEWKLGNQILSTQVSFSKTDLTGGVNTIILTVTDNDEANATDTIIVNVEMPPLDSDSDGMIDDYEIIYGLNPYFNDSQLDLDNDGKTNIEEYNAGTLPNNTTSKMFSINLLSPWSLVSLELNASLDLSALDNPYIEAIRSYQNGQWYVWTKNHQNSSELPLTKLEDGYGYWIKSLQNTTLEIRGNGLPDSNITIIPGVWNMLGSRIIDNLDIFFIQNPNIKIMWKYTKDTPSYWSAASNYAEIQQSLLDANITQLHNVTSSEVIMVK